MKKFILVALLIVCLAIPSFGIMAHAQKQVTLSAWTHDQLYLDYFNSRLSEWEAANPDISFTYDFRQVSNAPEAVLTALAAGEEVPDLLGIEQGQFPNYMKDGIIAKHFLDLTDLIGDRRSQYAEGRWALYSYEGRIYAVESQLAASVYYYQPAIFEANGVEVPKTWEEALQQAKDVFGPKGIALGIATDNENWFAMMLNQRGGAVFDQNGEFVLANEENKTLAVEVAAFIQEGVKDGLFLVVPDSEMWSGVTIPTAHREGRLAGEILPDWWSSCCLKPGVEDMAGQWRIAPPFVWEGGGYKTQVWGGTGWAVSTDTDNTDIAWKFLDFMYLGHESQVQRFEKINMFPTMFEAMKDPRVSELTDPFYGDQAVGAVFAEIADGVPVWYQSPFRAAFNTASKDNCPLLFDGTLSPEEFVDELIRVTQEEIEFAS